MTNILILSVGTRNKIVQYFKKTLTDKNGKKLGRVIATDMSEYAPAIYEADAYHIVPKITDPNYINIILNICHQEEITGILSLIDPELGLLAKHEDLFEQAGVQIIGSNEAACNLALDKMKMYEFLSKSGYLAARSYINKEAFIKDLDKGLVDYPVFVKPIEGSASIAINRVDDSRVLDVFLASRDDMMIQEFLDGQEIGADVYIDMISGQVVSIFLKEKLVMRAGETDKSRSFIDEKLFELITRLCRDAGFRGQIDIDIFNVNGQYYISEVNPRFGGGYPHAYECGVDHMQLIINNLKGIANPVRIGGYKEDVHMMKYNEVMLR